MLRMDMDIKQSTMRHVINAWLPSELADRQEREEPARFSVLVGCLKAEVAEASTSGAPNRWQKVTLWVPLLNR